MKRKLILFIAVAFITIKLSASSSKKPDKINGTPTTATAATSTYDDQKQFNSTKRALFYQAINDSLQKNERFSNYPDRIDCILRELKGKNAINLIDWKDFNLTDRIYFNFTNKHEFESSKTGEFSIKQDFKISFTKMERDFLIYFKNFTEVMNVLNAPIVDASFICLGGVEIRLGMLIFLAILSVASLSFSVWIRTGCKMTSCISSKEIHDQNE